MQSLKQGRSKVAFAGDSLLPELTQAAQANGKLGARRVAVGDLDRDTIAQMWSVFRCYYADISRDRFLADLSEKQYVIV